MAIDGATGIRFYGVQSSLDENFPVEVDVVYVKAQLALSPVLVDSVEKLLEPVIVSPDAGFLDCLNDKSSVESTSHFQWPMRSQTVFLPQIRGSDTFPGKISVWHSVH